MPDDVTEDRGLKELFTDRPLETVEVFVPELLAERGKPMPMGSYFKEIQEDYERLVVN